MTKTVESVKADGIKIQVSADKVMLTGWVSEAELLAARKLVVQALVTAGYRVFAVKHHGYSIWWTRDESGHSVDRRCMVRVEAK